MNQRPIKFRAWDREGEEYAKLDLLCVSQDGKVWEFDPSLFNPMHEITSRIIFEQFTGLHDKNGKEIYEGDILREIFTVSKGNRFHDGRDTDMTEDRISVVEWRDMGLSLVAIPIDNTLKEFWGYDKKELEVIGNLHEIPDILNA